MGLRGTKPRQNISTTWSSGLAYCVGLLATDGCLYNDGRHMSMTSKDLQLIELFKSTLGLHNKIGYKRNGAGTLCSNIQFGSVVFFLWLKAIGLTPRKSLTIAKLNVPRKYFFDFIRGCFDGDGSIYSYMDRRWANSHMFYISFASASKNFLDWLRSELSYLTGISGHIIPFNKSVYQLRFAKEESLVLIRKMYYNPRVPCLERKRDRTAKILETHKKISENNARARVH